VAAAGAEGVVGTTPIVITAVPVSIFPLGNVVVAVTVNCVGEITTVGVPEIVPVAVSRVNPAGSGPWILKLVFVAPVAVIDVVTGDIAVPTVPFTDAVDGNTATGVTIVEVVVVDGPEPAEFVATTVTVYSVPGVNPVTATGPEIAADVGVAVPTDPDVTGETVTVYEVIVAPPFVVEAPTETFAEVVEVAVAVSDAGAPGRVGTTLIVTVAVPVEVAPPATVVVAVIV
jgi:hypothetical protein